MALAKYFLGPVTMKGTTIRMWVLQLFPSNKPIFQESTKAETLKKSIEYVKEKGGSLMIQKKNGQFQEERTYPRSADPKSSKG